MWKRHTQKKRFNQATEVYTFTELFVKSLNNSYVLSVQVLLLLDAGSQPTHVYAIALLSHALL
jgi:hypothetical protein